MRRPALMAGLILLLSMAVVPMARGAQTGPARPGTPPEASTAEEAAKMARDSGLPVEDLSGRTERSQRFAKPDGSWRLEQNAEPVRIRRADGAWTTVDPTLRLDGGAIRPVATAADVRFSADGTGPFAIMRTALGTFALSWESPLRAPELAGDTARYRDVLPGVDLVVRATADGFAHAFVVKDRAAAANPKLRTLRLGLSGGLHIGDGPDGGLAAVTGTGAVAVSLGEAFMWDSTDGSTVAAPGDGALRAPVTVRSTDTELRLDPDPGLLADPTAVFPLVIDPPYAKPSKRFAFSNSTNEPNDAVARVGLEPTRTHPTYRSYFTFDVAPLRGKRILTATLQTLLIHSWSCGSTPVDLYKVTPRPGTGRVPWQPAEPLVWLDEKSGHAHKPSTGRGCSNDPQKDMPMEFGSGNLLRAELQTAAGANATEFALAFSARSRNGTGETIQERWKKFSVKETKLVADYNSRPDVPANLSADGAGCGTGDSRPFIATANPRLRARVGDADGDTDLRFEVVWERQNADGTWAPVGTGTQTGVPPGSGEVTVATSLVDGGVYRWRAQAHDPFVMDGQHLVEDSGFSDWCEFTVDTTGPSGQPTVTPAVYGTNPDLTYGTVGRTADFTFDAAGETDIASYRWGWADPPTTVATPPAIGGPVTLAITPPAPKPADPTAGGLLTLYVVSVDRAGHSSPLRTYPFHIGKATGPAGAWDLADPVGSTTLADSSGGNRPALLTGGGSAGAESRLLGGPTAVSFDGVDDAASVATSPANTGTSVTVSVWVRPAVNGDGQRTVLAASGNRASAFLLRREADNKWTFSVARADTDDAALATVTSTTVSRPGIWTHLTGVYDAGARQITWYVNGVVQGSAAAPAAFTATGGLEFGRGKWNGNLGFDQPWDGSLAEVRIWDRVLSTGEIAPLGATLAGRWRLNGDGTDVTSFHRTATGPASVGWVDDRFGLPGSALALNGKTDEHGTPIPTTESLATTGPALRTDQSFTVSAWVLVPEPMTAWNTAVAQNGVNYSGFYLGHRKTTGFAEVWEFSMKDTDTIGAGTWAIASAVVDPEDFGRWVHLTGVWDAGAGQLRLYVNGALAGSAARTVSWAAGGPLAIGRSRFPSGNAPADGQYWVGGIDEVRVYQGALPGSEIAKLAV